MAKHNPRIVSAAALFLGIIWAVWAGYEMLSDGIDDKTFSYSAAANHLEDGNFADALREYNSILSEEPANLQALRGKAQALMQMEDYTQALDLYNEAIGLQPEYGVTYANRGILKDRMGDYEGAVADYERSAELTPEVTEGPGWLDRFLRNRAEKPPTVASRASYLREQLSRPESERVLRIPELDKDQLIYRM